MICKFWWDNVRYRSYVKQAVRLGSMILNEDWCQTLFFSFALPLTSLVFKIPCNQLLISLSQKCNFAIFSRKMPSFWHLSKSESRRNICWGIRYIIFLLRFYMQRLASNITFLGRFFFHRLPSFAWYLFHISLLPSLIYVSLAMGQNVLSCHFLEAPICLHFYSRREMFFVLLMVKLTLKPNKTIFGFAGKLFIFQTKGLIATVNESHLVSVSISLVLKSSGKPQPSQGALSNITHSTAIDAKRISVLVAGAFVSSMIRFSAKQTALFKCSKLHWPIPYTFQRPNTAALL